MSSTSCIAIASDSLLAIAHSSGPRAEAGCAALLDLLTTCKAVGESIRHELSHLELSSSGFSVLTLLLRHNPAPLANHTLADQLGLAPQTISDTLARLELAQLIVRIRDTENRRRIAVRLTDQGHSAITNALGQLTADIERRMQEFDTADLAIIRHTCAQLHSSSVAQTTPALSSLS